MTTIITVACIIVLIVLLVVVMAAIATALEDAEALSIGFLLGILWVSMLVVTLSTIKMMGDYNTLLETQDAEQVEAVVP